VDEAWRLERELWEFAAAGRGAEYYAKHMMTEGFVILPGRIIERPELIAGWATHDRLDRYELSDPRMVMVDGDSVLIIYHVTTHSEWVPNYSGQVSALYTLAGTDWALVFRQHTPDGDAPFEF